MPPRPQRHADGDAASHPSEQLPGGRQQRRRTREESETFAGKHEPRSRTKTAGTGKRWSYVMQDTPDMISAALHDVNKGYVLRVGAVTFAIALTGYAAYTCVASRQDRKPLAKRWTLFARPVPITLLEKNREGHSNMYVYRFALPNSYDYAGYDPVSSVRVISGDVRELSSLSRWYTPISHPEERGFIEFAIKDCDPGRMSARLRYLEPGDVVYLGRWMKEFDYNKMKRRAAQAGVNHAELGLICTTGGASIALQLMNVIDKDPRDATKLSVLYCHACAHGMPFRESHFDAYQIRNPDRVSVKYNVLSVGAVSTPGARNGAVREATHASTSAATSTSTAKPATLLPEWIQVGTNVFLGNLDPDTIRATMPPPMRLVTTDGPTPDAADASHRFVRGASVYRPQILVCGPQSLLNFVSGRVSPWSNYTYWQGPFFRYNGFLKDMGYERKQVYKFGVSTHFLAMH